MPSTYNTSITSECQIQRGTPVVDGDDSVVSCAARLVPYPAVQGSQSHWWLPIMLWQGMAGWALLLLYPGKYRTECHASVLLCGFATHSHASYDSFSSITYSGYEHPQWIFKVVLGSIVLLMTKMIVGKQNTCNYPVEAIIHERNFVTWEFF